MLDWRNWLSSALEKAREYPKLYLAKNSPGRRLFLIFSLILVIAAIFFITSLVLSNWQAIQKINWHEYLRGIPRVVGLLLISIVSQLVAWILIISHSREISLKDVQIFSIMLLVKYLPGTAWHLIGRVTSYVSMTKVASRPVIYGTLFEILLLYITGAGLIAVTLEQVHPGISAVILVAILLLEVLVYLRAFGNKGRSRQVVEAVLLFVLYSIAWISGGMILYFLARDTGSSALLLKDSVRIWVLVGGVGLLVSILPLKLGIRQSVFTVLLSAYLPLADALITGFLMGLAILAGDVIWGSVVGFIPWLWERYR